MAPALRTAARITLLAATAWALARIARGRDGRGAPARLPRRRNAAARHAAAIAPGVEKQTMASNTDYVRPAGRDALRDRHRRWDEVDEASDESFPASDPPARY